MPRAHDRIIEQLPAQRLRVGDFVVDAATREVVHADPGDRERQRISLKAMDVLLALAAQPGKVVSRSALLDAVWPDTMPTDEVVTQAVAQLRKAFGDGKPSEYIETISKHGYRLKAVVAWLTDDGATPIAAPEPSPRGRSIRVSLAVLLIALCAGAAWWAWRAQTSGGGRLTGQPVAPVRPEIIRLTSRPGSELWPSPSPDGALVVYSVELAERSGSALMLQTSRPVQPTRLTDPPAHEHDVMPAWSPDGREIAFIRYRPGSVCRFMRIAAVGGNPTPIAPCLSPAPQKFSWHPDGTRLVVSGFRAGDMTVGNIGTMEVATGRATPLQHTGDDGDLDAYPVPSPDGRWIAFQRNVSRGDLWLQAAAGGVPRRLTRLETNFYGLSWTPDGRSLVYAALGEGAQTQLQSIDIETLQIRDLGVEGAQYPQVAGRAPVLAFVAAESTTRIYRVSLPARGTGAAPRPEHVFASTGVDAFPSVSPDGRRIAFLSDRSGSPRLWIADLATAPDARPVEAVVPRLRYPVAWSPDGNRLLMAGRDAGRDRLYEVDAATAHAVELPLPEGAPTYASYLGGMADLLVVADRGSGRLRLTRYDIAQTPWRAVGSVDDVAIAMDDGASGVVFARPASWGLWRADARLRDPIKLDDLLDADGDIVLPGGSPLTQGRRLVRSDGGFHILGGGSGCLIRWIAVPRRADASAPCLETRGGAVLGASLDRRNGQLYYALESDYNDDIGWMALPSGPPPPGTTAAGKPRH